MWASIATAALPDIVDKPTESEALQPDLIVTAFGGGEPDFFELYNQSAQPIKLADLSIEIVLQDTQNQQLPAEEHVIDLPSGWLLPKQYFMLQRDESGNLHTNQTISYYKFSTTLSYPVVSKISLIRDGAFIYSITPSLTILQDSWVQHRKRTQSTLKLTNSFLTDYTEPKSTVFSGYADVLYVPPSATGLQVIEILPNARDCSPLDDSATCGDYVKLYNPTDQTIDIGAFRLRTDSGGMKSSASNTVALEGVIAPDTYWLVQVRNNGEKISLTNTGGYVWLEDHYGVIVYEQSVVAYPDASSAKLKGVSWALDNIEHTWRWMFPQPEGANKWEMGGTGNVLAATLADCGPGKERNPATNRCRAIATAKISLVPCKPGQVRNPETNRCRSASSTTSSLQACGPGKYRNPETNRCKNITTATNSLKPCKPGQERNLETNRCRKSVIKGKNIASVTDNNSSTKATKTGWWIAGAGALLAVGYGVFEWRQDIVQWVRKKFFR